MQDAMIINEENLPALADDSLLRVAEMAEKRIEAVIKIKQMALKVTNPGDWIDQSGRPYLYVSGSEKIANLFNISWQINEPEVETESDGHFTYTFRGTFRIPGRSITAEGSRSSKDPFFKKYDWVDGKKIEKPISAIDRRDVRMAAMTNLFGNGITRILGIRNLSYEDLAEYAGITKDMIEKVDYGKGVRKDVRAPLKQPVKKKDASPNGKDKSDQKEITVETGVSDVSIKEGINEKTDQPYTLYYIKGEGNIIYRTFSESFADVASQAQHTNSKVKITFVVGKYGNSVTELEPVIESEGEDATEV